MSIAFIGGSGGYASASISMSYPAGTASGHLAVMVVSNNSITTPSGWTLLDSAANGAIYYRTVSSTSSFNITISGYATASMATFSGAAIGNYTVDGQNGPTLTGLSSSDYCLAAIANTTSTSPSNPTGYTTGNTTNNPSRSSGIFYKSSPSSSETPGSFGSMASNDNSFTIQITATGAGSDTESPADSSTATDASAIVASASPSDSSSSSDKPGINVTPVSVDSSSSSDVVGLVSAITSTDSSSSTDIYVIGVSLIAIDSSVATDSVIQGNFATYSPSERVSGSEGSSISITTARFDSSSSTDVATFTSALNAADSGSAADAISCVISSYPSEMSTSTDTKSVIISVSALDSSATSESTGIVVLSTVTDSSSSNDTLTNVLSVIKTTDSSGSFDLFGAVVSISTNDTSAQTDASFGQVIIQSTETLNSNDLAGISVSTSISESSAISEKVYTISAISPTETSLLFDNTTFGTAFLASETLHITDVASGVWITVDIGIYALHAVEHCSFVTASGELIMAQNRTLSDLIGFMPSDLDEMSITGMSGEYIGASMSEIELINQSVSTQ